MAALPWGKGVREDAVSGLLALLPTADNKVAKLIEKPLKHLEKSLATCPQSHKESVSA